MDASAALQSGYEPSRDNPNPGASSKQPSSSAVEVQKRKRPRGGKKRRNRRQSFAAPAEVGDSPSHGTRPESSRNMLSVPEGRQSALYEPGRRSRNLSDASLDSQALLDHREQQSLPPRRPSLLGQGSFGPPANHPTRPSMGRAHEDSHGHGSHYSSAYEVSGRPGHHRSAALGTHHEAGAGDGPEDEDAADDRTPLISSSQRGRLESGWEYCGRGRLDDHSSRDRSWNRPSTAGTSPSRRKTGTSSSQRLPVGPQAEYDVNNPPSVPPSPQPGADLAYEDVMIPKEFSLARSPHRRAKPPPLGGDALIHIDEDEPPSGNYGTNSSPATPRALQTDSRKRTLSTPAEQDVCFPLEGMSEIAEEDVAHLREGQYRTEHRRRRGKMWPDLAVLEEWSHEEKEERNGARRAKTISEPVLVGGRLRPNNRAWHKMEEEAPYRFTYFNEELPSTIHSQTISELLQPGQTFRELFIPDPPELSEDESSDEEDPGSSHGASHDPLHAGQAGNGNGNGDSKATRRSSMRSGDRSESRQASDEALNSSHQTPGAAPPPTPHKTKRYGPRPVFWLDVLSPTDAEMKVIAKTFGIHPLTAEDILMQEAREKVELFRKYYFVNYRTFEQDVNSEHYLDPVNLYVVVFREGVISFHFSMVPHPAHVRRRIRQLKDYLILSSDWISYAIIDDITDAFAPLSQSLEDEVDDIEDAILRLHSSSSDSKDGSGGGSSSSSSSSNNKISKDSEKRSDVGEATIPSGGDSGGDMLRRVGDCRKKVMGLYRLLGNKADVIKGFAKRCNEQWEVAPRSEIGLYLGDIQDHIITMTSNLGHCESVLSRSHSNYLAQINIRMNERQEQTADVLGRLTVLGTIVLPMNIITGLWGMNCLVPGQGGDGGLTWFWSIAASLLVFGVLCYFIAKRVYGIV